RHYPYRTITATISLFGHPYRASLLRKPSSSLVTAHLASLSPSGREYLESALPIGPEAGDGLPFLCLYLSIDKERDRFSYQPAV
ncbi:hypothetical protein JMJ77_0001963, partial [Colletotrichum scovillei]